MRHSLFSGASVRATLAASALTLCSVVLAAPAWAQGNSATSTPVTRAQVRAELDELVGAGYNPRDWYHYPDNLWAAQRIVEQRHTAQAQADAGAAPYAQDASKASVPATQTDQSMGGVPSSTSASGGPIQATGAGQTRVHSENGAPCAVGPQCNTYFGR